MSKIKSGIRNYEEKFEAIKYFIDRLDKDPKKFPKEAIVFTLDDEELSTLFTKERLKLINIIKKKKPKSVRELAKLAEREESAVSRDLRILEDFDIVELIKNGKISRPVVKQALMIITIARIDKLNSKISEDLNKEEVEV